MGRRFGSATSSPSKKMYNFQDFKCRTQAGTRIILRIKLFSRVLTTIFVSAFKKIKIKLYLLPQLLEYNWRHKSPELWGWSYEKGWEAKVIDYKY